jgi:hypothetical protein
VAVEIQKTEKWDLQANDVAAIASLLWAATALVSGKFADDWESRRRMTSTIISRCKTVVIR